MAPTIIHPCKFTYYNIILCHFCKFPRREIPIILTFSRFHFLAASPTPLRRFYNVFTQHSPYPLPVPSSYQPNKNRTLGELIGRSTALALIYSRPCPLPVNQHIHTLLNGHQYIATSVQDPLPGLHYSDLSTTYSILYAL